MKKLLSLMLLCMVCMGASAVETQTLTASTDGNWENQYRLRPRNENGNYWLTAGLHSGAKASAGKFAFVEADGANNYYIYSVTDGQWLTYSDTGNGAHKITLSNTKTSIFNVTSTTSTADNAWGDKSGYLVKAVSAGAYMNFFEGPTANDYQTTGTVGFYSTGSGDAGSVWVLEVPEDKSIFKGEAITAQSQLSNGDKIILNVKAKSTEYYVYFTGENATLTAKNNYRAHAFTETSFPENHVWEVVNVDGVNNTFQLRNCANTNAYMPNGYKHNNGDGAATLYMRQTTGYTGETRFAFSFNNFPSGGGATWDTYHFDTNANTNATGIGLCFWGYNQTTTDTQGAFALYRAVEKAVVNVTYNITVTDDNGENSITFSHIEEEVVGQFPVLDLDYVKDVQISDASNVSSTNKVFTATAKYDYPMKPGKIYQLQFGTTYVQYVNDNNVSLKMASDVNNDKNLWYIIPSTETFNKFKLCNAYKGQAVGATKDGENACNFKSVAEQGDEFTFIKHDDKFQINWYNSTQNLGSHGNSGTGANTGLGKWNGADTQFAAFEVEAAELKLTNPNDGGTSGLDGKYVGTFSAVYNVALPTGVMAYTAEIDGSIVNFVELGDVVPAKTGVLLFAVGATAPITAKADVATDKTIPSVDVNALKRANGEIAAGTYVLGKGSNGVGFYARQTSTTVANKAYLEVPTGVDIRSFRFDFEEQTTGVESLQSEKTTSVAFDLAGRRINANAKGISIVNGKKYIK